MESLFSKSRTIDINLIMYLYFGVKMDLGNFAFGFSASYAEPASFMHLP